MADTAWEELSRTLRSSAPYKSLAQGLGDMVRLPVPAAAWVGELLARDLGRPLLVLVPREADALTWMEAARLFGREEGVVYFPAPSLTPYQETETSLMVRAQESVALDCVDLRAGDTVVATPRALFRRLPAPRGLPPRRARRPPGRGPPDRGAGRRHLAAPRLPAHRPGLRGRGLRRARRHRGLLPAGRGRARSGSTSSATRWSRSAGSIPSRSAPRTRWTPSASSPSPSSPAAPDEARHAGRPAVRRPDGRSDWGPEAAELLEGLRTRGEFPGWENYLPLLAGRTVAARRGAGASPLVFAVDPPALEAEAVHHAERLEADFAARREHGRLAVPPEMLEQPAEQVREMLETAALRLRDLVVGGGRDGERRGADFHGTLTDLFHGQLPRFPQEVATARARGERCIVVVSPAHRRRIEELLEGREVQLGRGGVELVGRGARRAASGCPSAGVVVYGEQQLLPQAKLQRRRGQVALRAVPLRSARPQGGGLRGARRPRHRPVRGPALGGRGRRRPGRGAAGGARAGGGRRPPPRPR